MGDSFDWECPHCGKSTTITEPSFAYKEFVFHCNNKYGGIAFCMRFITCPNEKCKEYTLDVSLYNCIFNKTIQRYEKTALIKSIRLVPPSNAKVYSPAIIPQAEFFCEFDLKRVAQLLLNPLAKEANASFAS